MVSTTGELRVPGPKPMPVVGRLGNLVPFFLDPIGVTNRLFKEYGDIFSLVYGGGTRVLSPLPAVPGTLFCKDTAMLRRISTQHDLFNMYPPSGIFYPLDHTRPRLEVFKRWATGLWDVNSDTHRAHRRLLMPAFHKKRIESYRDDIVRLTCQMMDSWKAGERRNIHLDMLALFRQIATKTLFGQDSPADDNAIAFKIEESYRLYINPITRCFPTMYPERSSAGSSTLPGILTLRFAT
jgi:cytochrome P450